MHIEFANQTIIYYLCHPYIVETSYRGYFKYVLDVDTEEIIDDYDIVDKVIKKYTLFSLLRDV